MKETDATGKAVAQASVAALDAFQSVQPEARIRDRKERLLQLQGWVRDVFGVEGAIRDVERWCRLSNVCLAEVAEVSENPQEQQAVAGEVLLLFEQVASRLNVALDAAAQDPTNEMQRQGVYCLFFCTSACLSTISPGNCETPISAEMLLRVVNAGMAAVNIVFLSERWRELAGEESWCQIVEMYRAFIEDVVEAITSTEGPSEFPETDRMELVGCVCRKLFKIGAPLADWTLKSYAALKVTWVSIVALLNTVPEHKRDSFAKDMRVNRVFFTMVEKLSEAVAAGRAQKDTKQIKVARFWLVLISKLVASYPEALFHNWHQILVVASKVQTYLSPVNDGSCPEESKVKQDIKDVVQARLAAILRQMLSDIPKEQAMAALEGLCQHPDDSDHTGNGGLKGQVLVILLLLSESPSMSPPLRHLCVPCFKWMLGIAGVDLFHQCMGSKEFRCDIIQKSLLFLVSCCKDATQGPSAAQTWKQCQTVLMELALEGHPMVNEMLGSIWGAMLNKASARMQKMHISALFTILSNLVVGCLVKSGIDNKTRQLAFLYTRLLMDCNEEVQRKVWERVFDTVSVTSLHRTAVGCVILEASHQQIQHKCLASKWAREALKTLQQIETTIPEAPHAANKVALEQHGQWLLRCLAALFRNSSLYGHHLDAEDSILTVACKIVQDWEKRPSSFLGPALEVLAAGGRDLPKFHCVQLLPMLSRIVHSRQHTAEPVARLCKQTALTCPPSEDLFHVLLSHPHWLVMHHAMEAIVAIARQSDHQNLLELVPVEIRGNSDENSPFIVLLKAYLQRRHEVSPDQAAAMMSKMEAELKNSMGGEVDIDEVRSGIERIKLQHSRSISGAQSSGGGSRHGEGKPEVLVRLEQCIEDVGRERKRLKGDGSVELLDRFNQEVESLGSVLVKQCRDGGGGDGGREDSDVDLMEH